MKRLKSWLLIIVLLVSFIFGGVTTVSAAGKNGETRTIAIVFDNSGSMYDNGDQAWCRATYAMEVFASMLNQGDTLFIYPMHPITVGGKQYTMDNPFSLTDSSQAAVIRDIYTEKASTTPIESIDAAAQGLRSAQADEKSLIVLTDGDVFYESGSSLGAKVTRQKLDTRFQEYISEGMQVMYLGIGGKVVMPSIEDSENFTKQQAKDSKDVLSSLTRMCNLIFGRDSLPETHLSENSIDVDISIGKMIVFVQGENVSDLTLTGNTGVVGEKISSASTKYGTAGCGNHKANPDTSLQGMMVTYTDCSSGSYKINYSGEASSVEVYYEPDADLDFVFTHDNGQAVDPNALYEGNYKIGFGMKDAKTGELISSDLLGNISYQGSYYINGEEYPITCEGASGEIPVTLNMGDTFDAKLTVTYLSGYSITKESTDFGWPEGGVGVAARPAGELTLTIEGGEAIYSLKDLEEGTPYTATVFYKGQQLTGKELEKVDLKWDPDTSNVEIMEEFADDHYNLSLHYKEGIVPEETVCGECTVTIYAFYTEKGSAEAKAEATMTYNVEDDFSPVKIDLITEQDYFVISELDKAEPIIAALTINGETISPKDFASTELLVDCDGLEYELTPNEQDSSYEIRLLKTDGIEEGKYTVTATAVYTDNIGRVTEAEDDLKVTLSGIPLWMKWAIRLAVLLILIIILWIILHIKVLPKKLKATKKTSHMSFDGDDVTSATNFSADLKSKQLRVQSQYAGKKFGVAMDVVPGKESFLYKPQKRKSAEVKPTSVKKFGAAKIQEIMIGSVKYEVDDAGKIVSAIPNQKPFTLRNGSMVKYSGTINDAGVDKDFEVSTKLNF